MVKKVASDTGLHATFMPKPLFGLNGSGMHTHQSLFKGNRNAFYDSKAKWQLSKIALQYIGGLLNHAKALRGGDQPDGELLQAVGARLRGAHQRGLVGEEPLSSHPRS